MSRTLVGQGKEVAEWRQIHSVHLCSENGAEVCPQISADRLLLTGHLRKQDKAFSIMHTLLHIGCTTAMHVINSTYSTYINIIKNLHSNIHTYNKITCMIITCGRRPPPKLTSRTRRYSVTYTYIVILLIVVKTYILYIQERLLTVHTYKDTYIHEWICLIQYLPPPSRIEEALYLWMRSLYLCPCCMCLLAAHLWRNVWASLGSECQSLGETQSPEIGES